MEKSRNGGSFNMFSRPTLFLLLFVLYLASTVPVGLMLYGLKSRVGWDVFAEGGFHAYVQCLQSSFPLSEGRSFQNDVTRVDPPRHANRSMPKVRR
jgi:hypothetical protein